MDNLEDRLIQCFKAVFPELDGPSIRAATLTSVDGWDSVTTVTLISLLEEEFGTTIDLDDVDQIVSFEQCLGYVKTERANG